MTRVPPSYFVVQVGFAPLPPPWSTALREIEVESSVSGAAIFRLHFDLSRTPLGDFDALAIDLFRPLVPITIRIAAGPGVPLALVNGYVADTQVSVQNTPGASTLEVVGMDALGTRMANVENPRPWPNMSDDQIVAAIFARYGITPLTIPTPQVRTVSESTTLQRGTDAAFLQQLAGRNGVNLYLQPEPLSGRDIGHFHPPLVPPLPPQGVLSIDFGRQTNLDSFSVSNDMRQPTTVVGFAQEPRTRVAVPVAAPAAVEPPLGLEPLLARILPPGITWIHDSDAAGPAETQLQAMRRATESARAIRATAEVDGLKYARPLFSGVPVLVRGAGRLHSGPYLVESVTHHLSRSEYKQSATLMRNALGLTGAEVFVDPLAAA